MIWNHVNEEKFMFQIGAIIPIVLTLINIFISHK